MIKNSKQGKPTHKKDKDFLIYDADVLHLIEKLKSIQAAVLIASNPSIELWFLLHYKKPKELCYHRAMYQRIKQEK